MATSTVILSNYNHGRYLDDSLGRICHQTRAADQIIVVDDGSTDNSLLIIEDFARRFSNIEVVENGVNLGLQKSIARAMQRVHCDYLAWAAADDRLLPEFIERNMAVLERHPEAGLSFSETTQLIGDTEQVDRFATNPHVCHTFDLSDMPEYAAPSALLGRMKRAYLPIASNTAMLHVGRLRQFGGFPAVLQWHSDSFLACALAMRYGACIIPETLALIRAQSGSYSGGMHDPAHQTIVLRAMLSLLRRDANYRSIRHFYREAPSMMSPFGVLMLEVMARRPLDWDIMFPYAWWSIKEYKRGYQLTWPEVIRKLSCATWYRLLGRSVPSV